jgi:hypothetical protein
MKLPFVLAVSVILPLLNPPVAKADAYDDKARAAAAQQEQAAQAKAYAENYRALTASNQSIIRRIPRGAMITLCYNTSAMIWRSEYNGCRLANVEWNGIPVQICTEDYNENLPPEIVECHYHVAATGQDCDIVRNPSMKPSCL